jgi:hypothetical protein
MQEKSRPYKKPTRITEQAEKLRSAIEKQANRWLTRRQIASAIGKKRLTPYDIDLLDLLADHDLIQMQQEEGYSREGYRWVYGIFNKDENS